MTVVFEEVQDPEGLQKALAVRAIVFCGEQGIDYAIERDGQDPSAIHVVGQVGNEPVAAGRIRLVEGWAQLERIAVRKPWRGQGIGHQLTEFMMGVARKRGFARFRLHAQNHLRGFYMKHGFQPEGPVFQEAGIDHVSMVNDPLSAEAGRR
jgi:predicted GNAT family N-acyltransferase